MSEKENKLQQQGRRPKKAGIGKLPGKKKENFIIAIDDKYISDPNKFGMDEIVIIS
jgi:hypothetical protein